MKSDGLWRAVTAVVRSEISDDERNLLSGAEFSGIRSGVARIRLAENEKMINLELLAAKLSKAFSLISGRNIACKFATNGSARLARLPHPPRLNEFFTFENYIVGPANRLAHAAILSCGEKGTAGFNPVVITGGTGLGKTHLLQASLAEPGSASDNDRIEPGGP
ncbi:MAG: DnaA/Hda family protein, partial [Candidatus Brocadiia bacterium]